MAHYVVDASVVIEALVTGSYTANAEAFFQQVRAQDILVVPEFCLLECTNVLWRHTRFHGMTISRAQALIHDLQGLPLKRVLMKRLLADVLQVAAANSLAAYDSAYITLAQKLNYPLLTIDMKQSEAAIKEGVTIIPVTAFMP